MHIHKITNITVLIFAIICCSDNNDIISSKRYYSESFQCRNTEHCFELIDSLDVINKPEQISWQSLPQSDNLISFHDYSDAGEYATILALENYKAEEGGEYLVRLGSDDGFRLFVNGKEVGRKTGGRAVQPDSDWIKVNLNKGLNQLLFQVNQGSGSWGLYFEIEPLEEEKLLIKNFISEIYRDLPQSVILEDSVDVISLRRDSKQNFDTDNTFRYRWMAIEDNTSSEWTEFKANEAPSKIQLPQHFDGYKLFEYELVAPKGSILYKEIIPIYHSHKYREQVAEYYNELKPQDKFTPYIEGLELQNPWLLGDNKIEAAYSTRHKTEFLLDIELLLNNKSQKSVGGPRTYLYKDHLYREYKPHFNSSSTEEAIIGLHVELEDTVNHYFKTYAGQSHSKMAEWNSYAQISGKRLIFPYINQTENDWKTGDFFKNQFPVVAQKSDSISVMSWSKGVPLLLNELAQKEIKEIQNIYLISSWLLPEKMESFVTANRVSDANPHLSFTVIHGREDTDIPYSDVELWQDQLQNNGLNSTLKIIPYSSHWTYWKNPEKLVILN